MILLIIFSDYKILMYETNEKLSGKRENFKTITYNLTHLISLHFICSMKHPIRFYIFIMITNKYMKIIVFIIVISIYTQNS